MEPDKGHPRPDGDRRDPRVEGSGGLISIVTAGRRRLPKEMNPVKNAY